VRSAVPDESGTVRVDKGGDVKLPCHVTPTAATNVTWLHRETPTTSFVWDIYVNGQIFKNVRHRFSIYNATAGDYSLIILNIEAIDGGRYRCFDQQEQLQNYVVNVKGEYD